MRAGRLRHRIELQKISSETTDAYGERTPTWKTYAHRWASIEPAGGSELLNADVLSPQTTHVIRLRHTANTDVKAEHRLVSGSRTFHVTNVLNVDEKNQELILACRETTE